MNAQIVPHQPQAITPTSQVPGAAQQASAPTATIVSMWLRTKRKSIHTGPSYAKDMAQFMEWRAQRHGSFTESEAITITVMHRGQRVDLDVDMVTCPAPLATLSRPELEDYAEHLARLDYAPATQQRRLNAVRSLLTFAHDTGAIPFNVGAKLAMPDPVDNLAERILSKEEVHAMFAVTPKPRDRMVLRLLYYTGCRVEELANLTWRNISTDQGDGLVSLFGKGNKKRVVRIPAKVARELLAMRGDAGIDAPLFVSQKRSALSASQIWRVVQGAAKRAGIAEKNVSPHWLRHAHASHAFDGGAPPTLVRDTLGHSSLAITSRYAHARPTDSSAYYLE